MRTHVVLLRAFLLLAGSALPLRAQGPSSAAAPISADAPAMIQAGAFGAEPFVIRRAETVFSYNPDGTGYREQTFAVAVQSEAALRSFSVLGAPFAGTSEKAQLRYVRVRHPDGTVVETSPESAVEQPEQVTRDAPLYSDLKQLQLPVRSLRVGDTLEWQIHVERQKAEAPGEFWGQMNLLPGSVVLAETMELRVPAARQTTVWTNPRSGLGAQVSTEGTQKVYRWATAALRPTVGADAEAAAKAKAKAVLTSEEQTEATLGKLPDVAWTSFANWEAVGAWYRALEATRTQPDAEITAKVAELTAGKATLEEKMRAVYAYVSSQVRYVGVDLGVGRYQPHKAGAVLDNQYGDCKDKHTLLAAMLAVLGVHANAVLIGNGMRFNPEVPSPGSFNHVITQVPEGHEVAWLDTTEEVAPWRMMVASLRDKEALVVPDTGAAKVERTPADPPFLTFETMTASGALDKEGVSESHFTLAQRGDEELLVRAVLRQVTPGQYDELVQRIVANMGFGGTVSHAQFLHLEDTAQPLVIEWDYHREKAGDDWPNLRTLPQLMITLLPAVDEKEPPTGNVPLYGARDVSSTAEMKLPAGWTAELPEAIHARSEFGTYDLTFRFSKGTLYAERRWTLLKKDVPQADWKRYKAWTDEMAVGSEPFVQLRRASAEKGSTAAEKGVAAKPGGNTEAAQLVADAEKAIQANDLMKGSELLDKAKAINPEQRNLSGEYGWLNWRQGNQNEAIAAYSKEIERFPDSTWAYQPLSQLQYMTGDKDSALATVRRLVVQAPEDPDSAVALIALLLFMHKQVDAAKEADAALVRVPEGERNKPAFQMAVGTAQISGLEQEKGAATLTALLKTTSDPLITNNAVYQLADHMQGLALAESAERRVLEKLSVETRTWTLDEAPATLAQKSDLLSASWDTMGWVLYREGKFAEAEPYIKARWLFRQTAEVGQHLGDVQRALGQPREAILSYGMARALLPDHDMMGVRKAPGPEDGELEARIVRLKETASAGEPRVMPLSPQQAMTKLQELRTVPLPGALAKDGTAEYKLLLSSSGVKRVESTSGSDLAGGAELLGRAKFPVMFFPPGSDALLVRVATLNCHSAKCELIFHP